ncbi:hypothetical protein R7127_23060 [Vibrio sp. 1159]|uniref:hypothetical protein n=1 Tax=Vibrio sp. 1159 TaxID=3074545 RepID=UPI0029649E93|nr:hypothetical protein [Vibrio sp. 1159]MDW2323148.1 hypothetical protein [Vibrio sp. 1159]
MTYQANLNDADLELAKQAAETLQRMRVFFHKYEIDAEQGNKLISEFIKFTFDGNASFGQNSEDANRIERESPLLKQWMSEAKHIINYIRLENTGVIVSMFSESTDPLKHTDMTKLKGDFLSVLMPREATEESPVNGTVAVITCLCVNYMGNVEHVPAGGGAVH